MNFEKDTGRDLYFAQMEKELSELIDPKTGMLSKDVSQAVNCPLCEMNEYEDFFVRNGYKYVRCIGCGLVYANPQVLPEISERSYRDTNSSTELWMKVLTNDKEVLWRTEYFKGILSKIEEYSSSKETLLDVGCGVGHFLKIAVDSGWKAVGLDLSKTGVKHAKETLGLKVYQQTLGEASFEQESFDAVTMLGVLEHLVDPVKNLRQAVRVTRRGGVVAVVVPNTYSLLNMILREKSVSFDGRNHLVFFSRQTLEKAFQKAGLEVIYEDTVLTGVHNLVKYIQFFDPYGDVETTKYIPEAVARFINSDGGESTLEQFIYKNRLGLRLRMIGRRQ